MVYANKLFIKAVTRQLPFTMPELPCHLPAGMLTRTWAPRTNTDQGQHLACR